MPEQTLLKQSNITTSNMRADLAGSWIGAAVTLQLLYHLFHVSITRDFCNTQNRSASATVPCMSNAMRKVFCWGRLLGLTLRLGAFAYCVSILLGCYTMSPCVITPLRCVFRADLSLYLFRIDP